jgi:hypothetical protein
VLEESAIDLILGMN